MFSVPINPKLNEAQFQHFYDWLAQHRHVIYDCYFTSRMPPFMQDAMGDVFQDDGHALFAIEAALHIQKSLGIRVSATFNNIKVPPTVRNLDMFMANFAQLYAAGVRSATIPHTHWVAMGRLQREFPDLLIKNTILRNVSRPNEIAKLAEAGFHYVNLDRDLMRDSDTLRRCRQAADRHGIKLSLLANEGCLGNCPMMDEHFEFNNSRSGTTPNYFADPISMVSCSRWNVTDPSSSLKAASIPPWREDWDELLQHVDVFKMHGRESFDQLALTQEIISRWVKGEPLLYDGFESWLDHNNLGERPIDAWRRKIKTCRFDCWDCDFCDRLYASRRGQQAHDLVISTTEEIIDSQGYDNRMEIPGLTSKRVQNLLFGLGSHAKAYMEIGSAMGATAAAVGVNDIPIHCVDHWALDIQPQTKAATLPVNTKAEFLKNTKHVKQLHVHDRDMLAVDVSGISGIDLWFYDGPHDAQSTAAAVRHYAPCFADVVVLVFDDANWHEVVSGADQGMADAGLQLLWNRIMLNEIEDHSQWWNGLYLAIARRT